MRLRQFTDRGIDEFAQFLERSRQDPSETIPLELLEDDRIAEVVVPVIELDAQHFSTKGHAAEYLRSKLEVLTDAAVDTNEGLWTWLTLFFFDSVCVFKNGLPLVKNDYYYIYQPNEVRHHYRHLLHVSWQILKIAPRNNRLLLSSRLNSLDQVTAEVMKRLFFYRIPCIFELLDRLYWDEETDRPRAGIVDNRRIRPGNLRNRLPVRIRQLEKTYDLQSLTADQLLELLGAEFQHWLAGTTSPTRRESALRS